MSIGQVLANTLSPDQKLREDATNQLEAAAADNFAIYVLTLAQELANEQSPPHVRKAAGVALKNALYARDDVQRNVLAQRWINAPADVKQQVRQIALATLASQDVGAGHTAAQVVAAVAAVDLAVGDWPDLIKILLDNVTTSQSPNIRLCTLQAIGFTCEVIDPKILELQSNQILTAVIQGARVEEPSPEVRYEAIKALYNCLEFIRENFEREGERNLIMQVICTATQTPDKNIAAAAFECLSKIMTLFYHHMTVYMQKALFALTVVGMRDDNEAVSLQAIEFWSTVCDEEIEITNEIEECQEDNVEPERACFNFAKSALPQVLPVLVWLLTKQEEDVDDDEWNVSMAAATCLSLMAQCVQEAIVAPIVPFIENHIRSEDWHYREAAVMAFGSILDGPPFDSIRPLVAQALPLLIEMIGDPVVNVKDSAAWTLGRICDILSDCIDPANHLPRLIGALVSGLEDSPKIVGNCCWSLMNLSESLSATDVDDQPYILQPYFDSIMSALLRVSERPNESNSRTSAYEAMSTLMKGCGKECLPTVVNILIVMLNRLEQSIMMQAEVVSMDDRMNLTELQANLCSVITSIARRLSKAMLLPMADRIMTLLLQLLSTAPKKSTIVEDAFLTVGALTTTLETGFARYMDSFIPTLYTGLRSFDEYQLCQISVGLVGDICRALGDQCTAYCDNFMTALLESLRSERLHRSVKPSVLSCFGDVALAIGGRYEAYLEVSMAVLVEAASMRAQHQGDYDMEEYIGQLEEGILEAYVGIVQGLKSDNKAHLLIPHLPTTFGFLAVCYGGVEKTDSTMRSIIGLLGDLAEAFPKGELKQMYQDPWIQSCIKDGRTNKYLSPSTKETARWAREVIKRATA